MTDDTNRPNERSERDARRAEQFERYLDSLLSGGRPSPDDVADRDEAEMAHLAAEMAAAADPRGEPEAAFIEQLRMRMRQADQGIASVQAPPPVRHDAGAVPGRGTVRISRRQLLQGGLVGAAGIAAGALGASVLRGIPEGNPIWDDGSGLIAGEGAWASVANLADLPDGAVVRFSTPAFDGFVVNDAGEIRALSSVCTHMGCTLRYRNGWKDLRCPCHGASFNLNGELANGRSKWSQTGSYADDTSAYPIELPPLIRPEVKVEDDQVWVWTAAT